MRDMKKFIGIIGTIMLITAISLASPRYVVKASDVIIETQRLPELLTFEDFSKLYSCHEDIRVNDPKIVEVSQEDAVRLMMLGQAEAGDTDPLSIAYVMKVVLNRCNDENFPNSIEEVIKQKVNDRYSFSVIANGKYSETIPNVNAHYALYLLESGQIDIEAEYFEATWVENSWQSTHKIFEFEYAGHRYYK